MLLSLLACGPVVAPPDRPDPGAPFGVSPEGAPYLAPDRARDPVAPDVGRDADPVAPDAERDADPVAPHVGPDAAPPVAVAEPIPDDERSFDAAGAVIRAEVDGYFPSSLLGPGDVNGDGYDDLVVADYGVAAVYVWLGPLDGEHTTADAWATWSTPTRFSLALGRGGDLDGDGLADLLVGVAYDTTAGVDAGAVHAVMGRGDGGAWLLASADTVYGEGEESYAGAAVAAVGDVDGDGRPDVGVGVPDYRGRGWAGEVAILPAPFSGGLETATAAFSSEGGGGGDDALGEGVLGPGDLDGDGADDLVLPAPELASVYVWYGPVAGDYVLRDADVKIRGEASDEAFGEVAVAAGDQDGDGLVDLAVGDPEADDASGTIYVFASLGAGTLTADAAAARVWGESAGNAVGSAFDFGDLDGDGVPELLSNGGASRSGASRTYVVYGPLAGGIDLSDADLEIDGGGARVAFAGDMDADGLGDLAVRAHDVDPDAGAPVPGVYVLYGADL